MTAVNLKKMTAVVGLVGAILPGLAQATPTLARAYKSEYGYMPSCNACHSQGGGSTLNTYGKSFKAAGKNLAAFSKIAGQDSDGDGVPNSAESAAKSNPSDKLSTPSKPGNWLRGSVTLAVMSSSI